MTKATRAYFAVTIYFRPPGRPGVRQVPDGSGEQGRMEKTGCKIICGAPTTLAVEGYQSDDDDDDDGDII